MASSEASPSQSPPEKSSACPQSVDDSEETKKSPSTGSKKPLPRKRSSVKKSYEFPVSLLPSTSDEKPASIDSASKPGLDELVKDLEFVEEPSEDYLCPVTFDLLLEPQLTSCCGHHLSHNAVTRLQDERKFCPMCNGTKWSSMLDKFFRRKVHEQMVYCPHSGCEWVGEMNDVIWHIESCVNRPWECQYCALKCTYGEGEGKHWPTCTKFPEPCPNSCEVGSVERCNMEQHRSVCSLEPVACEMKEFGCSVVVPRKELATHMRESELQHLTAMTMLNLRLCRQLQQDSTERDRKMAQLQQEIAEQTNAELTVKLQQIEERIILYITGFKSEKKQLQEEMELLVKTSDDKSIALEEKMEQLVKTFNTRSAALEQKMKCVMKEASMAPQQLQAEIEEQVKKYLKHSTPVQDVSDSRQISKRVTFPDYSKMKGSDKHMRSCSFYSHDHGYEFQMSIYYHTTMLNYIGVYFFLLTGTNDDHLHWPIELKTCIELLNQAGGDGHVKKTCQVVRTREHRGLCFAIDREFISYDKLEQKNDKVNYLLNDNIEFRVRILVFPA